MLRRDLIPLLLHNPLRLSEIASLCKMPLKDVRSDLQHLRKTLQRSRDHRLEMLPATCRRCGFEFASTRFSRPGKCPACRGTWIEEPVVQVLPRAWRTPSG